MDWLALAALVTGSTFGYVVRASRVGIARANQLADQERRKKELVPMCLCGHYFNIHTPGGGPCKHNSTFPSNDRYSSTTVTKCQCMGYMGPDPMVSGLWHNEEMKGAKT